MQICVVIGNVWATKKEESLNGFKLLVVEPFDASSNEIKRPAYVAVDPVGAGIGELVLVVQGGSSARKSLNQHGEAPRWMQLWWGGLSTRLI